MEAVPRLPMISFDMKTSTENAKFAPSIKRYMVAVYNEEPDNYITEIRNIESLRAAAVRPTVDVAGVQLLKRYYCQLHFLKSRFPMKEGEAAAVYFSWKDSYSNISFTLGDIRFELMCVLYNIGALHTQLGAADSRTSADGLKMACTHFQCAAWAFQTVKETYHQMVSYISTIEVVHFMQQICFAQAQECILEKSMMDNRKATITAKVAVQVVDHYKRALSLLSFSDEDNTFSQYVGGKTAKEWSKYLTFKVAYHKCVALLFQGQQAEEQQKMGERVAFYHAACEQLEEARKLSLNVKQHKDLLEAIAFTSDVVEGKRKAAKNENEFIYHEEVPERHALQEVKGASLVKGIAFSVNDPEVSGPDIFGKLVPMEAHEAASLYSERKAQRLREMGELVESKDQALGEFMSSLQLEVFTQMRQATGLSQELVDRAAALSAKPTASQDWQAAVEKLSNSYREVQSMLNKIDKLLEEEEESEKEYQELMGKRPPSIIVTDLAREAAKYKEANGKAKESNQSLEKAMYTHIVNLAILGQPLVELREKIPSVQLPNPNVDESCVKEIESLISKVEEMRNQRAMLWTQYREAMHKDDIMSTLITRQAEEPLDQLFQQELQKHNELANLIEQNIVAQDNILKAFVDAYARSLPTRRYLQQVISERNTHVNALITAYDVYEDVIVKVNKGIDFYSKLETNVSKLLQRIRSASKVQQEEREQMLLKNSAKEEAPQPTTTSSAPKLKDYLDSRKKARAYPDTSPQYYAQNMADVQSWPPAVRPTPLGSEVNNDPIVTKPPEQSVNYSVDQTLVDGLATLRTYNYPQAPASPLSAATSANKQAYTMTTDTYQPISSITQQYQMGFASNPNLGDYGQSSVTGYAYNQVAQDGQPYQTYYDSSQTYAQNQPQVSQIQNYSQGQTQPTYNYQYYPAEYGTSSVQATSNQNYSYPSHSFGANEYATSVHPNTSTVDYSSTYSSPVPDIKSSSASGTNNYVMSNGQNYPSYDATGQYQYYYPNYGTYGTTYGYVEPQQNIDSTVPVTTKESNIDLLTGLDFTINQAPLIPQQKPSGVTAPVPKADVTKTVKPPVHKEETNSEKVINRKNLNNIEVKKLFAQEIEKYEKLVDVLTNKTLNGPTNLELKWKEIQDKQEAEKRAISVARCYPMKNRSSDILPYDHSRVELKGAKDDYINASHVRDVSYYAAPFIVTQAPMASTIPDFWTMIKEQQAELIVSLLGDAETGADVYWPAEKGRDLAYPGLVVSLIGVTEKAHWVERLISISVPEKRDSRVLMHLQFTAWPGSLFPTDVEPFVAFVAEVASVFLQQRNTAHPVVVHCSSGIGRSGLLCLLVSAILEVTSNPISIPDLVSLIVKLSACRKNILRDREHLKFAHEAFLAYMRRVLAQGQAKRILNEVGAPKIEEQATPSVEKKQETNDPLSTLDPFWASKRSGN